MRQKVIITGATSGIGKALAHEMHRRGHIVGLTGRRVEILKDLQQQLGPRAYTGYMDVTKLENAIDQLHLLIDEMNGMDMLILNAGTSRDRNADTMRESDLRIIDVNIRGFANLAAKGFAYFEQQGHGHLAGVSSIAALFGWGQSPAYNASKAFVRNYLQGFRQKANHSSAQITVTELQPGFVETEMTERRTDLFWTAPADKAARQMAAVLEKQKGHAYITKRWRLIAWLLKILPEWIFNRISVYL